MNKIWIFLWIFLIVIQMLTIWINRKLFDQSDLYVEKIDPQMIELANETNQHWPTAVSTVEIPDRNTRISRSDHLLRRESLLINLEELQSRLQSKGVELDVAKELQISLRAMDDSLKINQVNAYISGMNRWMQSFAGNQNECILSRITLYPGTRSSLPELAFEMNGKAEDMGRSLLSTLLNNSNWRLIELDLLMPDHESPCWIRGSCYFSSN